MKYSLMFLVLGMVPLSLGATTGLGAVAPCTRCVDAYGAVGDGAADDTQAVQKAVDDGYDGVWHNPVRVLFSPGKTYRVSKQIVLWAGVQLDSGADHPATILLGANTPGYGDPTHVKHVFMSRLSAARPGQIPDMLEDVWVAVALGEKERAKRIYFVLFMYLHANILTRRFRTDKQKKP